MATTLLDIGDRDMSAGSDEFYTPRRVRAWIGSFDIDPCAAPERRIQATRHVVGKEGQDGLAIEWGTRERPTKAFVNPPYNRDDDGKSQLAKWVRKCDDEARSGRCALVVALIPCRPSEAYWWSHVFGRAKILVFVAGRVAFANAADIDTKPGTFASVFVVWGVLAHQWANECKRLAGDSVQVCCLQD